LKFQDLEGNGLFHASLPSASTINDIVTLNPNNTVAPLVSSSNELKIDINPITGAVTGSYLVNNKKVTIGGVLYQKQNVGIGTLTDGTASGSFLLEPNPAFGAGTAGYGLNGDKTLPSVTIKAPAPNAAIDSVTHPSISFTGAASDKDGIAKVSYQVLYNGTVSSSLAATGTSNWNFNVTPSIGALGKYTVYIKATDKNGNESNLASRTVTYGP
jgi:hypothetical protein